MIVCSNCGTSNRDDERFCGNCGAFLEWEGTRVERGGTGDRAGDSGGEAGGSPGDTKSTGGAAGGAGGATGSGAAGGGTGLTSGETDSAGNGGRTAGGALAPEQASSRPGVTSATDPDLIDAVSANSATDRAETTAGLTGGSETVAAPLQPIARQPGVIAPRRPVRHVDEPRPQPAAGELTCPKCGSGNDSARRFCRACGSSLQVVAEEERLPWWRRLLNRLTNRRRRRDRRSTGMARRLIKITAFLCVLAILAVVGPPLVSRAITAIRDRTQPSDPIVPIGVTASSSAGKETPPERIIDGANNRFWAPQGPAVDAWVEAAFAEPTRLTDILIHSGVSTNQEKFLTAGRPNELALIATTEGGDTVEETLVLRDRPGEQKFTFRASKVVRVRLVIRSTYGPGLQPTAALAEVEFFGRT